MKTFSGFFLVVLFSLFSINTGYSQLVIKTTKIKPLFVIEANGGYDLPLLDLKGDNLSGLWNFTNYGVKSGFGVELKFKLSVMTRKMTQLRPYFTLGYSSYSNNDGRAYVYARNIAPG